ncbi:MAG: hypothetical protein M3450_13850 [Actinomycetota bacterium]|nr:hypothetical protein [Actinomycetota bacterium]
MSTMQQTEESIRAPRISPRVAWGLLGGGAFFFVGGSMHPGEDPPGLSLKEHLHLLFQDPAWYPSHALLLAGMVLIAASLVALVRGGTLASVPRAQKVGAIAAVAAVLGALDMLLHLVVASEASSIATGEGTPLTDVHVVAETLTVPVFGFSIAALGVVGALTRTMGNRLTAVLAVVGGVTYGLAGATFAFTDTLNFLFPGGGVIGLWAIGVGIWVLLQSRATSLAAPAT